VGVLFYLRSDGQYILVGDAIMAVLFLLNITEILLKEKFDHTKEVIRNRKS
jgi:hypothetical protein